MLRWCRERGDDAAPQGAVQAFRLALEVRTRQSAPADWAMTQNNLGVARETQGDKGGGRAAYEAAIGHYRAALEVFTAQSAPAYHQTIASNLARVQSKLARAR